MSIIQTQKCTICQKSDISPHKGLFYITSTNIIRRFCTAKCKKMYSSKKSFSKRILKNKLKLKSDTL